MERLLSPCTRLHDILESQGLLGRVRRHDPEPLQERNLDVSTEELLSAETAFTYADLYAMLENEDSIAWLSPHAAVVREKGLAENAWRQLHASCSVWFSVDGEEDIIAFALSSEHLSEICDVVLRLLAVSVVQSVHLTNWSSLHSTFINAPTLGYMMEQCQSLKLLTLERLKMDEDHCRVFGTYSRPGLEIVLEYCIITSAGAITLVEVLGRNQGLTKLEWCKSDNFVLADGLRGNITLKSLRVANSPDNGNRAYLAIASVLRENRGLVDLDPSCYGFRMNDDTLFAICDSLKRGKSSS
jgi:hypothetical protein